MNSSEQPISNETRIEEVKRLMDEQSVLLVEIIKAKGTADEEEVRARVSPKLEELMERQKVIMSQITGTSLEE